MEDQGAGAGSAQAQLCWPGQLGSHLRESGRGQWQLLMQMGSESQERYKSGLWGQGLGQEQVLPWLCPEVGGQLWGVTMSRDMPDGRALLGRGGKSSSRDSSVLPSPLSLADVLAS